MIKKLNTFTKVVSAAGLILSITYSLIPPVVAETFSIDGMALNTNSRFPLKDGHPTLSTYRLNPNDNDQQLDRLNGNLIRHRSTGKCLNAYRAGVGSIVNVYPCNINDGDQKFSVISVGNNTNLIQRNGTNLCIDMPNRNSSITMKLWNCESSNANQRFVSNAAVANNNPPPQASNPDISIRLFFNGNFTAAQRTAIQKAAQNWENIITSDMVPGGVLYVNVTEGAMSPTRWGETNFPYAVGQIATPRVRYALAGQYHTTMKISRSFLDGPNSYQLTKLATHELGHALYLDEASNDGTLGTDGVMNIYPLRSTITEGVYKRLEYLGYRVNRNTTPQW